MVVYRRLPRGCRRQRRSRSGKALEDPPAGTRASPPRYPGGRAARPDARLIWTVAAAVTAATGATGHARHRSNGRAGGPQEPRSHLGRPPSGSSEGGRLAGAQVPCSRPAGCAGPRRRSKTMNEGKKGQDVRVRHDGTSRPGPAGRHRDRSATRPRRWRSPSSYAGSPDEAGTDRTSAGAEPSEPVHALSAPRRSGHALLRLTGSGSLSRARPLRSNLQRLYCSKPIAGCLT